MRQFRYLAQVAAMSAFVVMSVAPTVASTASQREYKRGYSDCKAGRYDQNQHGASYKKGCRVAESQAKPAAKACPVDVSEANRYMYPGCR